MTGADACPVCGSADVSDAAGPIRAGQWWYRCAGCHFDRFGPAPAPVEPARWDDQAPWSATCPECSRRFDLLNDVDAGEWHYGHDCEPSPVVAALVR